MTKILGDRNCKYSAHSSYVRCAVNPGGPCEGCTHFEEEVRKNFDMLIHCESSEGRDYIARISRAIAILYS